MSIQSYLLKQNDQYKFYLVKLKELITYKFYIIDYENLCIIELNNKQFVIILPISETLELKNGMDWQNDNYDL